ncbi:hypothetical protein TIFTF001_016293 [Ficus carica]|uniref:Disease resistance protein At4g27190-like leucine-rich repeats domain-containing protein n=1 Tax=Ficus carica TaxID=3494 RepID=A0AA88AAC7_FICCA|nr:hypothetical protein TIFTF001_016293 [Ficus carica]
MESSFTNWNGLRARGSERNASLDELKELLRLTTLHVCVLDVNCLPENLFGENLKRYKVLIGDEVLRHCKLESSSTSRILKVKLNKSNLLNKGGLKVLLKRSEELYLDGLEDVNNVVFELDKGGFEELKHLEFTNNANIQFIVNSTEQIYHFSAFPSLESLLLDKLTNLEKICHGNLAAESFRNLRVIKVRKCDGLKSLFPLSIAMHLEIIEVIDCKRIDKVISYEREDPSSAAIDKVKFPQLRSLCLGQLPELIQFFCKAKESSMLGSKDASSVSITSAIPFFIPEVELPSLEYMKLSAIKYDQKLWTDQLLNELERDGLRQLKELIVENIVGIRFIVSSSNQQIPSCAFPSLESLHLENLMQLEKICDAKLAQQSFCKLKYVKVIRCNRLKNLWSFSISNAPSQLEELEVTDCNMMEEIFSCAEEEDTASVIELSQLLSLKLISASKLKQFCSTSPKKTERSTADSGMPFFNGKVNFPKLETLEICSLNFQKLWEDNSSLQLLSSPASFRNLTKVLVKGCRFMKNLFPSSVAANLVALRRIDVQECDMMEEILSVDDGTHKIIFHKLNVLTFANLPKLTRFSTGIIIEFPELVELTTASCPDLKTLIVSDSTSQTTVSFFNEKVAIPKLEKLVITCMDNLEAIWQSEALTAVYFTELKVIKIYECKNLTNMFPPYMLGRLHSLRRLGIRICALLKEVFQVQSSNNTINLSNLQAIIIYGCPSLKCLLPLSVARGLLRLEKLEINGCNIHEVVCAEVGVVDTTPRFLFPQLTSLQLRMLPELLHFYPRPHTSDWPLLKSLKVYNCKKLMAFPFEFRGLQGGRKLGSPPNVPIQPLISMKKVSFPNLEELILGNLASEGNTSHGQFSRLLGEEESADMAPSLRILEIFELPTLTHLWAENSSNSTLWSSKKLAPSSPSLQNLTTLRVSKCHGMLNLLTSPSSAKNLTQLTRMSIAECERMEEIVGDSGAKCEITFNGLEILVLHDLLGLKSFHSGNCIMRFPNLKQVIVSRCSEMEKFSFGAITPKLDRVITGIKDQEIWQETNVRTYFKKISHVYLREESSWDGDINTTIQHIRERDLGAAI